MKKASMSRMTRREFVLAAPAAAVAAGLGLTGLTASARPVAEHAPSPGLSVGYLQGSEEWNHLQGLSPTLDAVTGETLMDQARLVPAEALAQGDGRFAGRDARVTVHGFLTDAPHDLPRMRMQVGFRPYHGLQSVVWGYEGSSICCAQPASMFTVPIHADSGLQLSLDVSVRGSGSSLPVEAVFSPGSAPDQLKLRRGVYLLSWHLPSAPGAPDWSRYRAFAERIEQQEPGIPAMRRFMIADAGGAVKSLPVLVMSVAYADEALS